MKFPGDNTITLGDEAVHEMLKAHAPAMFGSADARITKLSTTGYPPKLEIHFTTDPLPAPFILVPPSPPLVAEALPRADDDHPF